MSQNCHSAAKPQLPPGFTNFNDILSGHVVAQTLTNVVGLVSDFRVPVKTKGNGKAPDVIHGNVTAANGIIADWKCQFNLIDSSIEDDPDAALSVNVFRPQNEMREVSRYDVVLLILARVCCNHTNDICID